jgi:hypothetical protein
LDKAPPKLVYKTPEEILEAQQAAAAAEASKKIESA